MGYWVSFYFVLSVLIIQNLNKKTYFLLFSSISSFYSEENIKKSCWPSIMLILCSHDPAFWPPHLWAHILLWEILFSSFHPHPTQTSSLLLRPEAFRNLSLDNRPPQWFLLSQNFCSTFSLCQMIPHLIICYCGSLFNSLKHSVKHIICAAIWRKGRWIRRATDVMVRKGHKHHREESSWGIW